MLIAETEALLARFADLSAPELQQLAENLDTIADYAERLAGKVEDEEPI
jgi:hypothetical protein